MTCQTIAKISAVVITLALAAVQHSKIGIGEGAMTLAGIEPIQSVSVIF
jgi:hypothetical protein